MNYALIDLASLAWLLPELESTIKSARTSLSKAHQSSGNDVIKDLTSAKRNIHEAAGALQVIEARGVVYFLETIEKTIEQCSSLGHLDNHTYAVLDEACFAFIAYLNELKNTGVLIQPVVLYPEYESLCLLNPAQGLSQNYHPVDLYFPNLVPRLKRTEPTTKVGPDARPINLNKVRNAYEILLLRVFKQNASQKDLGNIDLLLGIIANDASQAHAYSFWKSCQAVVSNLKETNDGLELGVKRWLGRLNLQIQRLTTGSKHLSEHLFREALYYLASSKNLDGLSHQHDAITLCYQLASSVPSDLKQRRYGHPIPADTSVLLDKLNAFKLAWDDAAPFSSESEGEGTSPAVLVRRLRAAQQSALDLQLSLSEHHLPVLVRLAQALANAAGAVAETGKPLHKNLGIEGAKTILWLEETIKNPGQTQVSQLEQVHALTERISESTVSLAPLTANLTAPNNSTQLLMEQVIRETMIGLSAVEKQLDDFFRYSQNPSVLQPTLSLLGQSRSTLDMLGLPQVALAIKSIEQQISGFVSEPTTATQPAFSTLAVHYGQITALLDLFTIAPERAQNDFIYDATSGGLKDVRFIPLPAEEYRFDSVESLTSQQRSDAQALIKEVVAKPEDPSARLALLESIQALKQDAALTGDRSLSALNAVSLNPATVIRNAGDITLDAQAQVAQAQSIANDAKTLAQLNALLSPTVIETPVLVPIARTEDDLYGIFLEEALGVLSDAKQLLNDLEEKPASVPILTDLRRNFHTLKGSSRMVGFKSFGDAAWHVEQVVNAALSRQAPASMDLIQFMRGGQEGLSTWLLQLDDALLGMDLDGLEGHSESPDFTVESNVASFIAKLAPYFQAIERGHDRSSSVTSTNSAPIKQAFQAIMSDAESSQFNGLTIGALDIEPQIFRPTQIPPAVPATVAPVESEFIRPKISLVANNEGNRPQDFIEKARSAVLKAQAYESAEPTKPLDSIVLQPVQISTPAKTNPAAPQDSMVTIGPLRLPKPLYDIYLLEAGQHILGLETDLIQWRTQAPRPSLYEAYRHAHSLKGSAATIGFSVIKELATPLENLLQLSVESNITLLENDLNVVEDAVLSIKTAFNSFATGQYPVALPAETNALSELFLHLTLRGKTADVVPPKSPSSLESETNQKLLAQALSAAKQADALALEALESRVAAASPKNEVQPASPNSLFDVYSSDEQDIPTPAAEDRVEDEVDSDIWVEFVQEADLIFPKAQSALVLASKDSIAIDDLRRDLHTLKGSSRMAGAMRMGAKLHAMESLLEHSVQTQKPFLSDAAHGELLSVFDDIYGLYETMKNPVAVPVATDPTASSAVSAPFQSMMEQASALLDDALSSSKKTISPVVESVIKPVAESATEPAAEPILDEAIAELLRPIASVSKPLAAPIAAPLALRGEPKDIPNTATENAIALPALRMRTDVLDHLVNQASEMSTSKGRIDQHVSQLRTSLSELTDNVDRLRKQLREIEIQAESQMATRTELTNSSELQFDPLEFDRFTRFQELTRMLTESLNDMIAVRDSVSKTISDTERELILQSKASKDLTQSLMRSRLVAFDAVSDRLYRVVRQAARELGKQVALDIQGGHLTVDRSILERISAGLEHLVRNSVVHGIELPYLRTANGKPLQGTITIQIKQQGNEFEITLSDDGSGLPLQRIRDMALSKGMISAQSLPTVQQLAELIFTPGFSTADSITELAGRGVGMDVVRSDIVSLGGRITLSTTPQQGTRFGIRIPMTLAVNQVLMVIAQHVQYAIPTSLIKTVINVKPSDLAVAYSHSEITQSDANYPFAHLAQLLNIAVTANPQNRAASVVLLSNGSDRVAVHVDQVIGNQEAVVKPLSTAMLRIPGLTSATLLSDGKLCFILDPVQLHLASKSAPAASDIAQMVVPRIKSSPYDRDGDRDSAYALNAQRGAVDNLPTAMVQVVSTRNADGIDVPEAQAFEPKRKLVMVIDDSLTVRKVTQKLLLREGWEVLLAKDGIDALEQLQTANPSILLVDIEMPRMDGFDLTRNVRADDRLQAIPIIMITSRIADKHRDHAFSLGVNAYMGKPYRDDELIAEMLKLTSMSV